MSMFEYLNAFKAIRVNNFFLELLNFWELSFFCDFLRVDDLDYELTIRSMG